MNGVFSASWSPLGNQIAFIGQVENSSDIYIYNIDTKIIDRVTNDVFSDSYPSWNPLGTEILFASDRGDYVSGDFTGVMNDHDYRQTDIYSVSTLNNEITRHTNSNTMNRILYGQTLINLSYILQIIMGYGIYLNKVFLQTYLSNLIKIMKFKSIQLQMC